MQELNIEKIAKACHEVNRAYCLALGDTSQPAWEDAPQFSAGLGFRRVGLARVAETPRANLAVHRTLRDKAAQRR